MATVAQKYSAKNPVKVSLLDTLAEQLQAVCKKLSAQEALYASVFRAHANLVEERDGIAERLKVEARKVVSPGEAKMILDSAAVSVSVSAPKVKVTYDYEKAQALWDRSFLMDSLVRQVDIKRVESMLLTIDDDHIKGQIGKAEVRTNPTPAVTIKYNAGG